ncbi:MAG: hypothetical protein AAF628_23485 [Planctomycetota bacterium]
MEGLIRDKGNVRLRIIDIDRWESPVATSHGVRRLPTLALYDGADLVSDDAREVINLLSRPER